MTEKDTCERVIKFVVFENKEIIQLASIINGTSNQIEQLR